MRVVFSSDWHINLKTDNIDRTDEIINIGKKIVGHCYWASKKEDVILILGGDIFNTNTPSEYHISKFIQVLNLIHKHNIKTYIMVGNHDSISDPERLSCLSFIRKIKVGYPSITLIDDIKFINIGTFDNGPLYFTFLPHISKALIVKKMNDGKIRKEITPQQYIDKRCEKILQNVGVGSQHYVFSHLNVLGAHTGSEENLLKKSDVFLPKCFTSVPIGFIPPKIIQAHLHSHYIEDNLYVVGSPIFCGFGEKGTKYFCDISISNQLGTEDEIGFIATNCIDFKELELNMIGETTDFFDIKEVKEFMNTIIPENNPIVKIDVMINPENNTYNWDDIKKEIEKHNCHVKPIIPRVVIKKVVRSVDQKMSLPLDDKIKVYLKKNLRTDLSKAKRIYKRTKKYLEI